MDYFCVSRCDLAALCSTTFSIDSAMQHLLPNCNQQLEVTMVAIGWKHLIETKDEHKRELLFWRGWSFSV